MNPMLAPPPYYVVTQGGNKNDKPPTYDQIMQEGDPPPFGVQYAEPATSNLPSQQPLTSPMAATTSATGMENYTSTMPLQNPVAELSHSLRIDNAQHPGADPAVNNEPVTMVICDTASSMATESQS